MYYINQFLFELQFSKSYVKFISLFQFPFQSSELALALDRTWLTVLNRTWLVAHLVDGFEQNATSDVDVTARPRLRARTRYPRVDDVTDHAHFRYDTTWRGRQQQAEQHRTPQVGDPVWRHHSVGWRLPVCIIESNSLWYHTVNYLHTSEYLRSAEAFDIIRLFKQNKLWTSEWAELTVIFRFGGGRDCNSEPILHSRIFEFFCPFFQNVFFRKFAVL